MTRLRRGTYVLNCWALGGGVVGILAFAFLDEPLALIPGIPIAWGCGLLHSWLIWRRPEP